MLTGRQHCPIACPLYRPHQTTQPLPSMHDLALNQHLLSKRHWSDIRNIQRPRHACVSPKPWLGYGCQRGCRTEVEDRGCATAV